MKLICSLAMAAILLIGGCQSESTSFARQFSKAKEISRATFAVVSPDLSTGCGTLIERNGNLYLISAGHIFSSTDPKMMNESLATDIFGHLGLLTLVSQNENLDVALFKIEIVNGRVDKQAIRSFSTPHLGMDIWTAGVIAKPTFVSSGIICYDINGTFLGSDIQGELGSSGSGIFLKGTSTYIGLIQAKEIDYPHNMIFLSWDAIDRWLTREGL